MFKLSKCLFFSYLTLLVVYIHRNGGYKVRAKEGEEKRKDDN